MRADYLDLIETGYEASASNAEWLQRLAEAALPLMNFGLGVVSFEYDTISNPGHLCTGSVFGAGVAEDFLAAGNMAASTFNGDPSAAYCAEPPVLWLSEVMGREFATGDDFPWQREYAHVLHDFWHAGCSRGPRP